MRLCRFGTESAPRVGFYDERPIVPLTDAIVLYSRATRRHARVDRAHRHTRDTRGRGTVTFVGIGVGAVHPGVRGDKS